MSTVNPQYNNADVFQDLQTRLLKQYIAILQGKYKKDTVNKHIIVLQSWINYVYGYHSITKFEDLTVSMCSSKFRSDYNKDSDYPLPLITIQNILKPYLKFANDIIKLNNPAIYRWLKLKT